MIFVQLMWWSSTKIRYSVRSFLKGDFKASINVFLEALPLTVGIALATGVPIYSGFVATIIGGILVTLLSNSQLSIRGAGAGIIPISITAIAMLDNNLELFFAAVAIAGLLQIVMGKFKLGNFAYFIPSVVVKGIMAAVGILLIIIELPFIFSDMGAHATGKLLLFHFTSAKGIINPFLHIWRHLDFGVIIITAVSFATLTLWNKKISHKVGFLPPYLVVVIVGVLIAQLYDLYFPQLALAPAQYISIPHHLLSNTKFINVSVLFSGYEVWRAGALICLLVTLLSLVTTEAIDKLDHYHRITRRNQELFAQGTGNLLSGLLGGLPMMTIIARSTTNVESGGRTKWSALLQGIWLLLAVLFFPKINHQIPMAVLALIIINISLTLAKPSLFISMYKAGRQQSLPFMVTLITALIFNFLEGLLVGTLFSYYLLVKNSYKAEYFLSEQKKGNIQHYTLKLSDNVSFLNKKNIIETLDEIPEYSVIEIIGSNDGKIDYDILEVIDLYKSKARKRHVELILDGVPDLATLNHINR